MFDLDSQKMFFNEFFMCTKTFFIRLSSFILPFPFFHVRLKVSLKCLNTFEDILNRGKGRNGNKTNTRCLVCLISIVCPSVLRKKTWFV